MNTPRGKTGGMAKGQPKPVAMRDATGGHIHVWVPNEANREYVEIHNGGQVAQPLTDWVLASLSGRQLYVFPPVALEPGATLRIHSGPDAVDHPPTDWRWTSEPVWRNTADVAVLLDLQGDEVARYAYPSARKADPSFTHPKILIEEEGQLRIQSAPWQSPRASK